MQLSLPTGSVDMVPIITESLAPNLRLTLKHIYKVVSALPHGELVDMTANCLKL